MTPYHIIGFLVALNILLIVVLFKIKKSKADIQVDPPAPPTKDGRTIRYAWIRIFAVTNKMYYTDTYKPGVQCVTLKTDDLDKYYADVQIETMNTAWIEHGIEFDPKKQ
ncbi:hypothetical protein FDH01_gp308 [Acinetobacter phage vB_AbaM_ME3]|uniref:Uncharacterized protein n=1 Tax=Acinetobacter phage vB_AbaM_ME3 TaxID=1837876 RepID=A0A172Q0E4_9CAUD|nr:hypothetical protein FDH01_gp308 [Acinetobacter phage vB_AbaM_ME3]AND75314.1 hypothetical protein ME3_153 [Acinetobacter phage vB_AbaM_ME3]